METQDNLPVLHPHPHRADLRKGPWLSVAAVVSLPLPLPACRSSLPTPPFQFSPFSAPTKRPYDLFFAFALVSSKGERNGSQINTSCWILILVTSIASRCCFSFCLSCRVCDSGKGFRLGLHRVQAVASGRAILPTSYRYQYRQRGSQRRGPKRLHQGCQTPFLQRA